MATVASPTGAQTDLYSHPGFAFAFAAFLRNSRNREWRRRRIDRFAPLDRTLATRTINLQGRIDASLVEDFLTLHGDGLRLPPHTPRDGDRLTVWIPAIRQGKRLLLDYSIRNAQGHSLPMLNRMEAAQAVAQDLLGRLVVGMRPARREQLFGSGDTDAVRDRFLSIYVLLTTLAFQYPFAVSQRLDNWSERGAFKKRCALDPERLRRWVREEGERVVGGLGEPLASALEPVFEMTGPEIELPYRAGLVARFSSIPELLLHSVQDLLEVLIAWPRVAAGRAGSAPGRIPSRDELLKPRTLAREAGKRASEGLDLLRQMLEFQKPTREGELARRAVMMDLERWTAYVVMDIRLGVPFQIKFSETLVLDASRSLRLRLKRREREQETADRPPRPRRRRPLRARLARALKQLALRLHPLAGVHRYPLALGDAGVYHVEVTTEDPELACLRPGIVEQWETRPRRHELSHFFSARQRAFDRLIHLYSTRRQRDEALYLLVRFSISFSVFFGYMAAASAFMLVGGYAITDWWHPIGDGHRPQDFRVLATVSALSVTLSLWLTRVQHPRAIVHRRLWWARWSFYLALSLIIGSALAFGARWFVWPEILDPVLDRLASLV